jgi:hypothetical protein
MKRSFGALLILVLTLVAAGCGDDNPAAPNTGSVSGTISFTGTWPSTGNIQVSIYSNLTPPYIPMGAPDAFSDPIAGPVTSFDYQLDGLAMGTYSAIYVGWRDPANPSGARLIGMYWTTPGDPGIDGTTGLPSAPPSTIVINSGSLNHSGLDITADMDLIP